MNDLQKSVAAAIVNVFETGRVSGNYSAVGLLKGDSGHLSYGRSQVSLGSGNLAKLLEQYCGEPDARFGPDLKPFLPRFQQKDFMLDHDQRVIGILTQAGRNDPVMRATQDQFFNAQYFGPACRAAEAFGITLPLGQAVVYDSHVQGGWGKLSNRLGPVGKRTEEDWINSYIELRRQWLLGLNLPLPTTAYRMVAFNTLASAQKWQLPLPLLVHGVSITEEALQAGELPVANTPPRLLNLVTPYLRGDDVKALQAALEPTFHNTPDGVYGPFTGVLIKKWQKSHSIQEDGAGPLTRKSLGL